MRAKGDPAATIASIRHELHRLDPGVEAWTAQPMEEYIKAASVTYTLAARLLALLGAVSLTLAALGVYGVTAYIASLRTREFGVRLALGASPGDLLRLVCREGLALAAIGIVAGLAVAAGAMRFLAGLLYGVGPFDPAIFTGVAVLLLGFVLLAAWFPARRAARTDPMAALRAE